MKMTETQLRRIIREALEEQKLEEDSIQQAKVQGPLRDFVTHVKEAQKDLTNLLQQVSDETASKQVEWLNNALKKILGSLNQMPALTKDPWHHVGKHG